MTQEEIDQLIAERNAALAERDKLRDKYAPEIAAELDEEQQKALRHKIAELRTYANLLEKGLKPKQRPEHKPHRH